MRTGIRKSIFRISQPDEFQETALEIFHYQAENNPIYKEFILNLGIKAASVEKSDQIPFLPIELFRNHKIVTGDSDIQAVFESSGTTGSTSGKHYITDLSLYDESFFSSFRYFYGNPDNFFFAALLPSYQEKGNSSLVYMVDRLIKVSTCPSSGFFRDDPGNLLSVLNMVKNEKQKGMLIGVTFALMDLAEKYSPDLSGLIVVETGGMKGRRKEITREELHKLLKSRFNIQAVNSEYGMTELLSQSWSKGNGIFYCPPWMKVLIRDTQDPLSLLRKSGATGGINVIDLANLNSCSFIATNDLGKLYEDGGFEVLGRFDNSDVRGCNLLVEG